MGLMMAESAPLGKRPRSDAVGTSMMAMLPVVRPGIGGCAVQGRHEWIKREGERYSVRW